MNMVSGGNLKKVLRSFSYALQGIFHVLKQERNMKIHFVLSALVIFMGYIFSLTAIEWLFIIVAIAGVISLELVNTAVERVVDLVTKEYHPLAKQAKDIAAGAVFVYAIISVIIALIIFLPKIAELF